MLATETALCVEIAHTFRPRKESALQMIRHRLFQHRLSAPLLPFWLALAAITALLALYGANNADPAWEIETISWVQSASPDALLQIAKFMTVIGRSPISTVLPAVAILAMWVWGQRHLSIFLAAAALARVLSGVVKGLVDRPRPSPSVVDVVYQLDGPSFPSGHVLGATLFYGFLIYCADISISNKPVRRLVQSSLAVTILLMGYSRVELGAHWPTDVLGGYAIALLVLSAMVWLHRRWTGADRNERPEAAAAIP